MQLCPHLVFAGDCEAAFSFYARVLGGELTLFRFGDRAHDPAWRDKIVHATLTVGRDRLAGADVREAERPRGFFVLLTAPNRPEAERIFAALADGGEVRMALAETFWSEAFGLVVDRFGVGWEVGSAGARKPGGGGA